MTTAPAPNDWDDLAQGELVIGPDEFIDGRVMCFAKNRATGRYFRLGRREAVILRGLVAGVPPEELSRRYHAATGRPLGDASFHDALRVFGKAGMFANDSTDDETQDPLLAPPPTIFTFNIYSWNPDADLEAVLWAWRWLATPWAFATVVLTVLAVELLVLADLGGLFHQAATRDLSMLAPRIVLFFAINGAMMLVHEGAHAIVCKAYGGEVREIGFKIRYLTFTPFTRLDDVLLFENRWKRAAVFLAGPLASLSILPLAYLGWLYFPAGSLGRQTSADFLIWYNVLFLMQFVPFLQLDGYHVMAQFLKMPHLRDDSYSYLYSTIRQWAGGKARQPIAADIARYVKPIYIGYGVSSFVVTLTILSLLITRYSHVLASWLGPWIGYGLVAVVTTAMLVRFFVQLQQIHRKAS